MILHLLQNSQCADLGIFYLFFFQRTTLGFCGLVQVSNQPELVSLHATKIILRIFNSNVGRDTCVFIEDYWTDNRGMDHLQVCYFRGSSYQRCPWPRCFNVLLVGSISYCLQIPSRWENHPRTPNWELPCLFFPQSPPQSSTPSPALFGSTSKIYPISTHFSLCAEWLPYPKPSVSFISVTAMASQLASGLIASTVHPAPVIYPCGSQIDLLET